MKRVHVIQHTHWDFEWYFTRNEAMVQFVYHMDEVFEALKNQVVDYYLLDGQMSILDDYLDAYPEKKSELKKWVKAKRLFIGPWYTQTDELIVTGESIIRNLSLGMKLADDLGGSQRIGYLPDSFGQGADMPKIYNGMDIYNALFWRGLPKEETSNREFNWQSEDGSEVTTINIKDGYFVGVGLIDDDNTENVMKTVIADASLDDIALPVGGDQRYVDYNLKDRIALYNDELKNKNVKLFESNYPKLFEAVNKSKAKLDNVSGEFITSSVSKIHRSIYSSRYDQKYLNDKVERRMIYQLEPLMAMADRIGIPYKKSLLDKIWKLVVRNHAHDSAGGCNSDKTNQIILERLREVDQLSYSTVDYLVRKISESEENKQANDLTFFNTLPFAVKKNIHFKVSLKEKNFRIINGDKPVDCDVVRITRKYCGQIKRDESQYEDKDYYHVFDCVANIEIPALQWTKLSIESLDDEHDLVTETTKKKIENDAFQIEFSNGTLNLMNKKTHEKIVNFLEVVDDGDEGDTYDYSPAYNDMTLELDFKDAQVTCNKGKQFQSMQLTGAWNLPVDLKERATKELNGKVAYKLTLTLDRNDNLIKNHLLIDNKVKDHRMRVIFNSNMKTQKYSYADTAFGYIQRPVVDRHLSNWKDAGLHEEPTSIYPMLHWTNLHDDQQSFTVMSKGIKEYQMIGTGFNKVALTLFRSVGFLGRPDLIRRPGVASGNQFTYIPTPNSQLQEELHFKFAVSWDEIFEPAQIMKQFQIYAITNPYYQVQGINQFTNTLKYFVMHPLNKQLQSKPFLEIKNDQLIFSSLTESKDNAGWLLRVYNPNKFKIQGDSIIKLDSESTISLTNFTGVLIEDLGLQRDVSVGKFAPGEVKTIRIEKGF
ncbi:glycoside hydrolase family 38 C-terminal domain-containing protein [Companilactobacillus bobalius]|uniref:Mannosylglycerate hydrolase n=2 Tax=Companilactobacillus bobalius TaxID=2801451 RepID=A0A202FB00_9LACO|nr:glycoside hydrolase family 38 C-terminal domain-containing protein [Companilactobacillus bobalius]KAE9562541.1 alpha-mannosidase [Companilactobacillus bobalius]OVE97608.1 Mannosylglycerate hydrolase [Companilactobacillus bobalius]GEO57781.1 alpha-mannosidase [Companilactobacillus paralimentarius]